MFLFCSFQGAPKLKEGAGSRHIIDSFRESEMNNGIFRDHLITKKEHE